MDNFPLIKVFMTEVIHPNDPRSSKFGPAKTKEIEGLIKRGTFKVDLKSEMPDNPNLLGGRFVLSIKDEGSKREIWKARFVVQGYRDKMKTSLVHDISTARHHSIRMLIGLAAIFGFRLFSTDVTQAYLQSAENLMGDVFIKAPKEFELQGDQILKLMKPLYRLPDSGDYWGKTMTD
eukprot:IDg9450t1